MHDKSVKERCIHNEVCKFDACTDCRHFREDIVNWPVWYGKEPVIQPYVDTPYITKTNDKLHWYDGGGTTCNAEPISTTKAMDAESGKSTSPA